VDPSHLKNTPLWGKRVKAQFRVEMFNVFNRDNLASHLDNLAFSSFGENQSTMGTYYGGDAASATASPTIPNCP
jgi:hypothetical protein